VDADYMLVESPRRDAAESEGNSIYAECNFDANLDAGQERRLGAQPAAFQAELEQMAWKRGTLAQD
jgi:hypothetical protein